MAGVAKRLRPRIVVPIFVGSIPITRPIKSPVTLVTGLFILQSLRKRTHHKTKFCFRVRARVSRGWKKEMMNFLFERRLLRTSKTSLSSYERKTNCILIFVFYMLNYNYSEGVCHSCWMDWQLNMGVWRNW